MTAWLNIIGMTEQGEKSLDPQARSLLHGAEIVIGVQRRLAEFDLRGKTRVAWQGSLEDMIARVLASRPAPTVLLASGDPNWFGIGATLSQHLPAGEFALHPSPSSFQLAASRLHWPLQSVATLSLHGRPVARLHPHVLPGNRVLALTSDSNTLHEVAALLVDRGYGASTLTVLENLGASDERVTSIPANQHGDAGFGEFYVLAIACAADPDSALLPPVPGLPDASFLSDGQLTKREVRAATLAKLAAYPGALLWDVGAGSGSVAIEWLRAARDTRAICFERNPERLEMIGQNAARLGVPHVRIVPGDMPQSLAGQPPPDSIFIGGALADDRVFDACWQALRPDGHLVANAVTLDGEAALFERQTRFGGELSRIEVSVLDRIGGQRVLRPRMPVTQWLCRKQAR